MQKKLTLSMQADWTLLKYGNFLKIERYSGALFGRKRGKRIRNGNQMNRQSWHKKKRGIIRISETGLRDDVFILCSCSRAEINSNWG